MGFAYDLTGSGKTVVRGGFGIMYERIQGNDMYNAGPNIPFSLQRQHDSGRASRTRASRSRPALPRALPINPASITGLAIDDYKQPASYQYSVGVQQQLNAKSVLSISYVGNQNRHQNDYREINLPNQSALPAAHRRLRNYNTAPGLPYPGFHSIDLSTNEANSHYNALQIDLSSQVGRDLSSSRVLHAVAHDRSDHRRQRRRRPERTCRIPTWAGSTTSVRVDTTARTTRRSTSSMTSRSCGTAPNRLLKSTIGGWEVSGIVTLTSGLPINPQLTGGQSGNGLPNATNRPIRSARVSYPHTVGEWFNTAAFADPAVGAFGDAGHNSLRGPGRDNWNLSLFKSFVFSETRGSRFELRVETFNTWNHTEFQNG